jgi:uncharacterized protein YcbX
MRATIAALNVYPVKSCRGIACERADVTAQGLAVRGVRDREWLVVDPHGQFLTQREHPRLALVEVDATDGAITLRVPDREPLAPRSDGAIRDVRVWRAQLRGHDAGDEAAAALSGFLGTDARLVRFDDARPRRVNPDYAGTTKATTLYADGYPVLVVSQASLDDLNARLAGRGIAPLPMNRFRPNLVIDGVEAYEEDHVETLEIGSVTLRLVKPCTRCEVTTTDQQTTRRSHEPLLTLSTYRRDDRLAGVTFGMNAIVIGGAGRSLCVGDDVEATLRF